MLVTKVTAASSKVTIAGKVVGPLAAKSKDRTITLQRVVACKSAETVKKFAPARSGSFSVTVNAPAGPEGGRLSPLHARAQEHEDEEADARPSRCRVRSTSVDAPYGAAEITSTSSPT